MSVYCIAARFAAAQSAVALAHDGDEALLVRDAERTIRVRLQCLPHTACTTTSSLHTSSSSPSCAYSQQQQQSDDDTVPTRPLALVVQPWNATCVALRVGDVLYERGCHPVVLRVGDELQLCTPGAWEDDRTFTVIAAAAATTMMTMAAGGCALPSSSCGAQQPLQQPQQPSSSRDVCTAEALSRWSRYYSTYYGDDSDGVGRCRTTATAAAALAPPLSSPSSPLHTTRHSAAACNNNSDVDGACRRHRGDACRCASPAPTPWLAFVASCHSSA